jgi:hypothetical protein
MACLLAWGPSERNFIQIKATRARLRLDQIAPTGWKCGPMNRPTLYYRLSLIWLFILAGASHFVVQIKGRP